MIVFNKPPLTGHEKQYVLESMQSPKISGDGEFTKKCQEWFEKNFNCAKVLLTSSCTHALEMSAMLLNLEAGDEIIMPSYTFVSTANAFVLRGANIKFVDIRPDTLNIDETKIEQAITHKTKAIVAVHYAGVACEMDTIMEIADSYNLTVIEDAAQGVMSKYKDRYLGTIGHIGAYSFHETKNYTSAGEGGALLINDDNLIERSEIIREKGTNRSQFSRGLIEKYTWVDIGSSYLMNDISAAYLWGQINCAGEILANRMSSWNHYFNCLEKIKTKGLIELPIIPKECEHNAHMFYIKTQCIEERERLIKYFNSQKIMAIFHYIPLHTSKAGKKYGSFSGLDEHTTKYSQRILRLPLYYLLSKENIDFITGRLFEFYEQT